MSRKGIADSLRMGILTPTQVSVYLGVSPPTIRAMVDSGRLLGFRAGGRGRGELKINTLDLLDYIAQTGTPAHADIVNSASIFARNHLQVQRYAAIIDILRARINGSRENASATAEAIRAAYERLTRNAKAAVGGGED